MPYLLLLLLLSACVREEPAPRFVDAAASAGIDFVHYHGARGDYYYPETFGSRAAFLHHDGVGWPAILLGHSPRRRLGPPAEQEHQGSGKERQEGRRRPGQRGP